MCKKFKGKKKIVIAIGVCVVCFFCMGLRQEDAHEILPMSRYEQFSGNIYDEERIEPKDMTYLLEKWSGVTAQDDSEIFQRQGWRYTAKQGKYGVRYYKSPGRYVLGWQYLKRDGFFDWYYFDEETGFMVCDTILDGVVLSKSGHAVAITAKRAETIELVHASEHCKEVLVIGSIKTPERIRLEKEVILVSLQDQKAYIRSVSKDEEQKMAVLEVVGEGNVVLGPGVEIHTDGNARNGVQLQDKGEVVCYGFVGNMFDKETKYGVAAFGEDTTVTICAGAEVSGAEVGVYSEGTTVIQEDVSPVQQTFFSAGVVNATTVSKGNMISGNTAHGILQNGGTLTMTGGTIYNNGTLGSAKKTGSTGGGVYLKNKAKMNMSGGVISGNRASYGGGIYVSSGCALNITGGTIGGTKLYESQEKNTVASGNYAREHKMYAGGKKYARGSGGGIYSEGTVTINGKTTVNISGNVSKGPGGAGGLLICEGKTYITGKVNISNNRAWHSDGKDSSQVASGDPNGEGAGIRVGYDSEQKSAKCMINCTDKEGYPATDGTVSISNNHASGDGGGIYVSNGSNMLLVIKGNTKIQNNTSANSGGGGIKTLGGKMWIYDADISGNATKDGNGGGVHSAGVTFLSGCSIYDNYTDREGGGVCFYKSSVGTVGDGTLYKCNVFNNSAKSGGAGVEVRNEATALIKAGTRIYDNKESGIGVRCTNQAMITLADCYIYNNEKYGVSNYGETVVNGTATLGYDSYVSDEAYSANPNQEGAIYNAGTFLVNKEKTLHVYSGAKFGLYNIGTATLKDGSRSSFLGNGSTEIIRNRGTLTAVGTTENNEAVVVLYGSNTKNGINNDGGILKWSGHIAGGYKVGENGILKVSSCGNIKTGLLNCNAGNVTTYSVSDISGCSTAVYNKKDAVSHLAGKYQDNAVYGLKNEGDMYLGTSGNMKLIMNSIVGIYNKGSLYSDHLGEYLCHIYGSGTGIKNEGVCYLGESVWIGTKEAEDRTGILNVKNGRLHISGGTYQNSKKYGVYCETGSDFYMAKAACIDDSNQVFLESDCYIKIEEPLAGDGTVAVLDTSVEDDRPPGRIMVQVDYVGGTGSKELYDSEGKARFQLAYVYLKDELPALLLEGSRIDTQESISVTDRHIYLSTCYPVTFDSGVGQIGGADESDVFMVQLPLKKYWMEDLILDLQPPALQSPSHLRQGWVYTYWEGSDQKIYSRTSEVFSGNYPLHLTAIWKCDKESILGAWLYDRSAWLRMQMTGNKEDEEYKYFLAGDTGIITFNSVNLTDVSILWPSTGKTDELKSYDKVGQDVTDKNFHIISLTEDISNPYENNTYQFRIPLKTPEGTYYVSVMGWDERGSQHTVVLPVVVGDKSIAATIRTRIR